MAAASAGSNPLDELSLELLYDGEKLLAFISTHWQLVGVLWLAVNCGAGLLLAQFHLCRKRRQRSQKVE